MEKEKLYGAVDIAKYVSAMLVVAIHTYPFLELNPVFNTFFIADVCRLAVPFFFVCSGYFLFRKFNDSARYNQNRLFGYLGRLLKLYLVWTVIYIPYTIWNYASTGFSVFSVFGYIRDFFLNGSYYHLWFLPALMLGIMIVFYLERTRGMKKTMTLCLVLYLIGYFINVYADIWQSLPLVNVLYGFFMKTMGTARNGIFFAPVFVFMGSYICKHDLKSLKVSAIGFGISFLCLILEVYIYYALGILEDLSCMFLSLLPASYFLMELLLNLNIPYKPVYNELRQDSTLIYVSHILFARILLMLLPDAHMVVYLGTMALAQGFAYLVVKYKHRFSWLNYLM